jgi:Rne/Rng family ribonuclease
VSRVLVADRTAGRARIGLLEDGRLIEVDVADQITGGPGTICLGRVRRVAHDLDGAFVDCGLGVDAFLTARDARALSGAPRSARIEGQVSEGQAVLVQIKRQATGDKGARVGTDIALPGICLMHRPRIARIELTPELARSEHAKSQQARAEALFENGGFGLRPAAVSASDDELRDEAARLGERWAALEAKAAAARPPALLDPLGEPSHRLLLEHLGPDLERIVFADRTALIGARGWLERELPRSLAGLASRLEHLPDAFEAIGAAGQLEEALGPKVALGSGGSLIIEPTAALTAIDVNGAGKPIEVDLEAAREVARQLRLRRIGGIVVIDFVDLETKQERARLDAALRKAFAGDPAAVQIYPMSRLGLVELSRQRIGPSLAERLGATTHIEETSDE